MTTTGSTETIPTQERYDDSFLEECALRRLEVLPQTTSLLEPLREAHEASYRHSLRVGEVMAKAVEALLPSGALDSPHTAGPAHELIHIAFVAGVVHDIGKQGEGIPLLLDMPRGLSPEEGKKVAEHTLLGVALLQAKLQDLSRYDEEFPVLQAAAGTVQHHHTPHNRLKDEHEYAAIDWIPRLAQIVDQLDARTDLGRAYTQTENARPNPGVKFVGNTQVLDPEALLPDIVETMQLGEASILGMPADEVARLVYKERFGTEESTIRPLAA